MSSPFPQELARRHRRRAVVRAHHPDLGGDPEEFIRQLSVLNGPLATAQEVVFVRRPKGMQRVSAWWTSRRTPHRPRVL